MAKIGNEAKLFLKLVIERAVHYTREINIVLEKKGLSEVEIANYKGRLHGISTVRELIGDLTMELESR